MPRGFVVVWGPLSTSEYIVFSWCVSRGHVLGAAASSAAPATPAAKSSARARARALTAPTVVPDVPEVPEVTSTVEVEICVASAPSAATSVQVLPTWLLIADPEPEPPRQEVVINYRRIVGAYIQVNALRNVWHHLGEYLKHIKKRRLAFLKEEENDGDSGGSPRARLAAGGSR